MCNEMIKLRQMLDDRGIKWEDVSTVYSQFKFYIHRTHFTFDEIDYSVINGCGTYGGYDSFDHVNEGLLELWAEDVNDGEPVGFLTAEEIIRWIELKRRMTEIGTVKNIAVLQRGEQDE